MLKRLLWLLLCCCLTVTLVAQPTTSYTFRQLVIRGQSGLTLALDRPVTALTVSLPDRLAGPVRVVVGSDTFRLQRDPHAPVPTSQLLVLPQATRTITLPDGLVGDTLVLTGVYARPLSVPLPSPAVARQGVADCQKPPVVPASVWRAGLTPPKEAPSATAVRFVVVHHEAGSNTTTDYVNVVRNIYVFHTQSNGWNDVGYNFLVAQDGTVFEGRDGQGKLDGDNVLGAHFCGTNSGTMGICLLGNFMTAQPSSAALTSLNRLITWKLAKEGITDPLGSSLHASSGKILRTVSAHRDGTCATECPGNNLYALMDQVRAAVTTNCASGTHTATLVLATELTIVPTSGLRLYPNPAYGAGFLVEYTRPIQSVEVVNGQGQRLNVRFVRETPTRWRVLPTLPASDILVIITDDSGNHHSGRVAIY